MFNLGFGELVLVVIVGIVVLGPRRLPQMMRTAGQWVAKLRRLSTDLRAQSGIDDLIRQEGIENEIRELRSLSSINVIDTLITPAATAGAARATVNAPRLEAKVTTPKAQPVRDREYPVVGCDSYGALPDDAPVRAAKAPEPVKVAPEPARAEEAAKVEAEAAKAEPAKAEVAKAETAEPAKVAAVESSGSSSQSEAG